jgi:multiple sugar transport system ATP-binding protein
MHGVNVDIDDGEFVVLVGPSGCGKSTLLRMIAGLEEVSDGTIRIGERVVNDVPPKDRDIAMVFQSYALYPHKTVGENIGFPLRMDIQSSSRGGSGSGWPWVVPLYAIRRFSCSTNPCRTLMPSSA